MEPKGKSKRIGYLGPRGTYTEQALVQYLPGSDNLKIPMVSIQQVINGVKLGEVDLGVVPVENSLEGSVNVTLDLLAVSAQVKIVAEIIIPIEHWLLLPKGQGIHEIEAVYSHNQALGQCREALLEILPEAQHHQCESTGAAARLVADAGQPWAAIGSRQLAETYGLIPFQRPLINGQNYTRFWVLGKEDAQPTGNDKTSIVFTMVDRPGGLSIILQELANRGINLTKIESRPAKTALGKYLFFADLDGHHQDVKILEAILELARQTTSLRILGSYPKAQAPVAEETETMPDLVSLRQEIDLVDQGIIQLLAKRAVLVSQIGLTKSCPRMVRDSKRESQILHRLRNLALAQGVDPELVTEIYKTMFAYSVSQQARQLGEDAQGAKISD